MPAPMTLAGAATLLLVCRGSTRWSSGRPGTDCVQLIYYGMLGRPPRCFSLVLVCAPVAREQGCSLLGPRRMIERDRTNARLHPQAPCRGQKQMTTPLQRSRQGKRCGPVRSLTVNGDVSGTQPILHSVADWPCPSDCTSHRDLEAHQ